MEGSAPPRIGCRYRAPARRLTRLPGNRHHARVSDEALTRVEFERTVLDLLHNLDRGDSIPDATHEIVILWWGLPNRGGTEKPIEAVDETEESLITRLYAGYCDATDDDQTEAERAAAAASIRPIVEALRAHISQRRLDEGHTR